MAARQKTLSGEEVTITETKATSSASGVHWFIVSGTALGVLDYLNENLIPAHKVRGTTVLSTTWHVLFHK